MEEGKDISNIIKSDKFLAGLLVIIVIAIFSFIGYVLVNRVPGEQPAPIPQVSTKTKLLSEAEIQRQIEEINNARDANNTKPLSRTEIQKQIHAIEETQQKNNIKPLSEEEIQKQIEEINKSRQ